MPNWITVLQGLLTPTIALIAVGIAYMQWRTAHQKVILDLFDRRLKVYDEINAAVIQAVAEQGNLATFEATRRIWRAWGDARFLFGPEVLQAIDEIRRDVSRFGAAVRRSERPNISEAERLTAADEAEQLDKKLLEFREPFTSLCLPYLKMDQKRVRTPKEWFQDANAKRLSYSDKN